MDTSEPHSVEHRESVVDRSKKEVLSYFEENGFLKRKRDGRVILDAGAIEHHEFRYKTHHRMQDKSPNETTFTYFDTLEALAGMQGYSKEEYEETKKRGAEPYLRDVIVFPLSAADLTRSFPKRQRDAILKHQSVLGLKTQWSTNISLSNHEQITLAEMLFSGVAFDEEGVNLHRDASGKLVMHDAEKKTNIPFTAKRFVELTGINPSIQVQNGGKRTFRDVPFDVAQKLLPHLCAQGVFKESDFRRRSNSEMEDRYGAHTRKITGPYVMFPSPSGKSARYYIGRDTIVGTTIPINRETMSAVQLDPQTVGILENVHGRKRIICTLDLLTNAEAEALHDRLATEEQQKGIVRSQAQRSAFAVVGANETTQRIARYQLDTVLPPRADESEAEYRERLLRLSDTSFVLNGFRGFFQEAGITVHTLPWEEQVILADVITVDADRTSWIQFGKDFGIEGVRALLAVAYDSEMKERLFFLARENPEAAKEIFVEYGRLVEGARVVARTITASKLQDAESFAAVRGNFSTQLKEGIVRRAKDMLYTAEAITRTGIAKTDAYGTRPVVCSNIRDVDRALGIYANAVERTSDLLRPHAPEKYRFRLTAAHQKQVPEMFEFIVENVEGAPRHRSYMVLQLREQGVPVGQHNKRFEFDGEARVNLVFSDKPMGLLLTDPTRRSAVSLRIDRDGKQRQGDVIVGNDPTSQSGEVSLEMGGFGDGPEDTSDNAVVGRVLTVGNALAAEHERKNTTHLPEYYHNRESFERHLGDADVFASLVQFIRKSVSEFYQHSNDR